MISVGISLTSVVNYVRSAVADYFAGLSFVAGYPAVSEVQNIEIIGDVMNLMPKGDVTATSQHSTTVYAKNSAGDYVNYLSDTPVYSGGVTELDASKLFGTFTATQALSNFRVTYNDDSKSRIAYNDNGEISFSGNILSGADELYLPSLNCDISLYIGSKSTLTRVYCYSNNLTGSIPDLSSNTALNRFYCHSNQLTGSIPDLSSNTALNRFWCHINNLTGSIPDLSSNAALTIFYCHINNLTGSIPDLSLNTDLEQFYCYSNNLTGSIPDLSSNTALNRFYCYSNSLTGYDAGWPAKSFFFNAKDNSLTETAVNLILTEADTYGIPVGTTINLTGGTNATPTGAGLTAKANLIANGAVVTTN